MFLKIVSLIFNFNICIIMQPIEIIKPIQIDNARLEKILTIPVKLKLIINMIQYSLKNIEDQILISPINVIQSGLKILLIMEIIIN